MTKQLEYLTLEVGSTITKANGFVKNADGSLEHVAQGFALTTADRNVGKGVFAAVEDLEQRSSYGTDTCEVFANSSAAGGLRVTVHGLTLNLITRAVKEASLGTGAVIKKITAGDLSEYDIDEIEEINPGLILLAGGIDYAAKETILNNALKLAAMDIGAPVVYAGNSALRRAVENIFHRTGIEIATVPNIFSDVDKFNTAPLKKRMEDLFVKHFVHAPGIERVKALSNHSIVSNLEAVQRATEIFSEICGDTLVIDVGGAAACVHSFMNGSKDYSENTINPEYSYKRTVEGDLGVFANAQNVIELSEDKSRLDKTKDIAAIPVSVSQKEMTKWLCARSVEFGVQRHAALSKINIPSECERNAKGRNLTSVKYVIGTGGALTRIEGGREILASAFAGSGKYLMPSDSAQILIDSDYLFSALGTIGLVYPELVKNTFKCWKDKNVRLFSI